MRFFMIMPVLVLIGGFGNFLMLLMIDGPIRDLYLRFNNISFWLLPSSLILLVFSACIEGDWINMYRFKSSYSGV
jgi:heme/copper-type cytochrome/quinol oxidase subunit 1